MRSIARGEAWLARGRPRLALRQLEHALAIRARTEERAGLAFRARHAIARCLQQLGRYDEAARHARVALRIAVRWLGEPCTASAHNLLGVLAKFRGRFAVAERHYRAALPVTRRRFGPRSRELATLLHNLGGLDHARGRFARGERFARRSVEIARALMPASDPERLAHEVAHAALLDGLGRQRESVPIYRRALAELTRLGARHEVATTLHNLASAEHELGRLAIARRHYEAALIAGHPDRALTQYNLALLHRELGEVRRAHALLRAALATFRAQLGNAHPSTKACALALAG